MNLIQISNKVKTTKKGLGYFEIYEKYFKKLRLKKLNILEIGVDDGGSIKIWKKYFPRSKIVGLDIAKMSFSIKGVDLIQGDQSDINILKKIIKKYKYFDIIIDDGSHHSKHIIKSFKYLFDSLKNDSLYIIEDLQTSYIPRYGGSRINLKKHSTSLNFFKSLTDSINYEINDKPFFKKNKFDGLIKYVHFYQNVVVIKKGHSKKLFYKKSNKKLSISNKIKKIISYIN